ncbi:sensor histidine kinase [Pseudothauera rhizosphaerae]|uniref:sensor histidine kinase n=1 Tax=Pseudothauera rhizosphaerae TaxID=2565932 RepID=UPI001454DC54|nr:CHASE2 domain-containing protein [Pseudothauera rhizosphaerae]
MSVRRRLAGRLRAFSQRSGAVLGLALAAAWLLAATPPGVRLEQWLQDAAQRLLAPGERFDGVLVVEIDEASLAELRPWLGPWPWPRDIYATVLDYLAELQARTVFVDVLFADPRAGDEALREALARNPGVVLAAGAVREPVPGGADAALLERLAWPVERGEGAPPAYEWAAAALPRPLLEGAAALPRVGLIAFRYDGDGVLRRIPLLHRIGDAHLPSAVLATLQGGQVSPVYSEGGALRVGERRWPVDAQGAVGLVFPANGHALPTVPLAAVAKAALGLPGHALDAAQVRGRTVFIGTTALFSDHVNTPRGVLHGVHVMAIAHAALEQGHYHVPAHAGWNAVLLLIALLPAVAARGAGLRRVAVALVCTLACLGTVYWLLLSVHRQAVLAAPLLTALAGAAAAALHAWRHRLDAARVEALDQAERQQHTVALVAHELKSPLAIIDMTLQNLAGVGGLPPAVQLRHQKIRRASRRLLALIETNLAEDRLRTQGVPRMEAVDLAEVVEEVVRAADTPALTVERESTGAPVVAGDREMLRVACVNLVGNAIKYSPPDAPVRVTLARHGGEVELRVADRGCGIAAEDQARIFEPYVRVQGRQQPGSGLGLALVRRIVEHHGGTVGVRSAPGEGAVFVVRLPAAAPD